MVIQNVFGIGYTHIFQRMQWSSRVEISSAALATSSEDPGE